MTDERFSDIDSLPLRALDEPEVARSDSRIPGLDLRIQNSGLRSTGESHPPRRVGLWPIVVALMIGLLVGYVAGHGVQSRASNSMAVASSTQPTSAAAPQVTSTEWSDRTIDEPSDSSTSGATQVEAPTAPRAIAPPPARALRPAPAPTGRAPQGHGAGSLFVDSRPSGADVYLNNKRVGQTPLSLSTIPAGPRVVRLERNGYRHWSSAIRVEAGQHVRVTASLERARAQ